MLEGAQGRIHILNLIGIFLQSVIRILTRIHLCFFFVCFYDIYDQDCTDDKVTGK